MENVMHHLYNCFTIGVIFFWCYSAHYYTYANTYFWLIATKNLLLLMFSILSYFIANFICMHTAKSIKGFKYQLFI